MTKHPAPGRVKTRLAASLGTELASSLYRAFVLDLRQRLQRLPYAVTWMYWPPTAPFASLLPGAHCRPQRGRHLGERLAHALATALDEGARSVLAIGADAPHIPRVRLREAVAALGAGADLALGPAADGGYYLIGVGAPQPALFARIPWSTSAVFGATLKAAGRLHLRTRVLPPSFDVDGPADLERLRAMLARGAVRLPRTAALLAACIGNRKGTP
jgi:rSAM/selenodomain-associated transferase 1